MDFDTSQAQRRLLTAVDEIVESCGGLDRAAEIAGVGGHDADLDAKLASADLLGGTTLLDRVLLAEHLAERGLATTFGLRAVLADAGLDGVADGAMAVLDTSRERPVRFGSVATVLIVLDGDRVRVREAAESGATPIRSSFGYPYADLDRHMVLDGRILDVPADSVRIRLRLALAAEIAGTAAAGIARTAAHLTGRTQFGRPLASLQALRHRLAESAVSAETVRWMTREAAWKGDPRSATLAAWQAGVTAAALAPELTQMCGARSFTLDFGLHLYTMRLEGLRLELGAPDRLATRLAATRHV